MKNNLFVCILLLIFFDSQGQDNKPKFGFQYKPIIPSQYFNSSHIEKASGAYKFNLEPKYSNSFGMILRQKLNKTFIIECGLNYTQRNYNLIINNDIQNINDFTSFGIRSYELPIQLLTYIRASKLWYLNVAFGISENILASDIVSYGKTTEAYYQNTYRRSGGYRAMLANLGMEYRTQQKGTYYIGASLHLPWTEIGRVYPRYEDDDNSFNDQNFDEKFFLEITGTFITIDLRYFFNE